MKVISAKNILLLSIACLITYCLVIITNLVPFISAKAFQNKSMVILNLVTAFFAFIILKLIDITTRKRKLDTNKNKVLIEFCKSMIAFVAIVIIMQNLGYNFNALLAVGGAGSLIVGFAAKDMISNIFGYITVLLDRPFTVGDLIYCEQHKVSGTVKKVGLRSTELTRADKKPVYVPNAIWTTASIVNSSRKTNRELDITLPLLCSDPDLLAKISFEAKDIIESMPDIDQKYSANVFIDTVDNYGAHIRVISYAQNISATQFYLLKEKILLNTIRVAKKHAVDINILQHD